MALSVILYCTLYALLNVTGATLIKLSLAGRVLSGWRDYLDVFLQLRTIFGFGLIFVSALVVMKALSEAALSLVVPTSTGINFALTVAAGALVLGEKISLGTVVGLGLILAGVIVVGMQK